MVNSGLALVCQKTIAVIQEDCKRVCGRVSYQVKFINVQYKVELSFKQTAPVKNQFNAF